MLGVDFYFPSNLFCFRSSTILIEYSLKFSNSNLLMKIFVLCVSGRTALGPIIRDERGNGNVTDGDDELLESLVKTATKTPATRTTPRERKRTRHADRKSCKCDPRTLHAKTAPTPFAHYHGNRLEKV